MSLSFRHCLSPHITLYMNASDIASDMNAEDEPFTGCTVEATKTHDTTHMTTHTSHHTHTRHVKQNIHDASNKRNTHDARHITPDVAHDNTHM